MKKLIPLAVFSAILLTGCFMKPYVVNVQQGNILDTARVSQLETGMTKDHVQYLLGDPVLVNAFDDNIWTYAYTNQINGGKIVKKQLTLTFKNDKLANIEQSGYDRQG